LTVLSLVGINAADFLYRCTGSKSGDLFPDNLKYFAVASRGYSLGHLPSTAQTGATAKYFGIVANLAKQDSNTSYRSE
jgi:hypothetical protein